MIIFDRFLCCINLKTFGKFVGWFGAMSSVLVTLLTTLIFVVKSVKSMDILKTIHEYSEKVTKASNATHEYSEKDSQANLWIVLALVVTAWIVVFIVHVLLIIGIKKKKSLAVLPYIFFTLVIAALLICHVTAVILDAIQNIEETAVEVDWTHNPTVLMVLLYTAAVGLFVFCIYFILCIYSLYEIIKFEEKRRRYFRSFDLTSIDKNLK